MKTRILFALMIAFTALSGCGPRSLFPTEYVEGIVTLDGKPIENAVVNFTPEIPGEGMPAIGRTLADGGYQLTALSGGRPHKGTMIGKYQVTIILDAREREPTQKEIDMMTKGASIDIPIIHIVPPEYNNSETSGLTAEVVKGKNVFDFDLSTAKK